MEPCLHFLYSCLRYMHRTNLPIPFLDATKPEFISVTHQLGILIYLMLQWVIVWGLCDCLLYGGYVTVYCMGVM